MRFICVYCEEDELLSDLIRLIQNVSQFKVQFKIHAIPELVKNVEISLKASKGPAVE